MGVERETANGCSQLPKKPHTVGRIRRIICDLPLRLDQCFPGTSSCLGKALESDGLGTYLDHDNVFRRRPLWHVDRIDPCARIAEFGNLDISSRSGPPTRPGQPCTAQVLQLLHESVPGLDHPSARPDDELASSAFADLHGNSSAMGHLVHGFCFGPGLDLHHHVDRPTILLPAFTPAYRAHQLLLPDHRGFDVHGQQPEHSRFARAIWDSRHAPPHGYRWLHLLPHGMGYHRPGREGVGSEEKPTTGHLY